MTSLSEAFDHARRLSPYQARFLQFVEQHPECLEAATFEELARPAGEPKLRRFLSHDVPIQPWPLFLGAETFTRFGEVARRSFELVRSLPERWFDGDARRLCEFYGLEDEVAETLEKILALPWRQGRVLMRGDFLLSSGQIKCIEINAGANAGGIFNFQVARAQLQVPILQRFFDQEKVSVRYRDPWRALLLHMIEHATARGLHGAGHLNLGLLVKRPDLLAPATAIIEPSFRALLAKVAPGTEGKLIFCRFEDLQREGQSLKARGVPIQILMQFRRTILTTPIGPEIEAWIDGVIDLYPGPFNWIYSDKRNLALISEQVDLQRAGALGPFRREEIAWVEEHLPWSRIVQPGPTLWRDQRTALESLLASKQGELVLKPAQSLGGVGVKVGCKTPPQEWEALVGSALKYPGTYIVQEYLHDDLQLQQCGEKGCTPCSINWGLFMAGNRFGGIYLRSCPPPESGVVNVTNGALDNCAFELLPAQEAPEESEIELVRTF